MEDLTDILDECGAGRVCMVGLHCCGDLTPLLMDIFSTLDRARALVCVGCCYHLMEYNKEETMIQNCPLSLLARQKWETVWGCKKLLLTPASLRLATQETKARWLEQLDSHAHCHFFRGILEAAANEGLSFSHSISSILLYISAAEERLSRAVGRASSSQP